MFVFDGGAGGYQNWYVTHHAVMEQFCHVYSPIQPTFLCTYWRGDVDHRVTVLDIWINMCKTISLMRALGRRQEH